MQMLGDKLRYLLKTIFNLRSFLTASKTIDKETFRKILETKLEFIKNEADKIFSDDNIRTVAQKSFAHISGTYEQKIEVLYKKSPKIFSQALWFLRTILNTDSDLRSIPSSKLKKKMLEILLPTQVKL